MIRTARIGDVERIIDLLINFANEAPIKSLHNPRVNRRKMGHTLVQLMLNGCVLVGEKDGKIQGMIIASIVDDVWLEYVKTLREVAWWVEPEYRHTTLGYRLLQEYVKFGKLLKQKEIISDFTMTTMVNSPELKLEDRGWRFIEMNYVYEGKEI